MEGAERFSRHTGYGRTLRFAGDYRDAAPRGSDGSVRVRLVAMDAMDYRGTGAEAQYGEEALRRELLKASAAFAAEPDEPRPLAPVATGNWGCGAFLGDKEHKAPDPFFSASALVCLRRRAAFALIPSCSRCCSCWRLRKQGE